MNVALISAALVSSGYISGKLVAVDGSKIKANTNRDGLTLDGINRQLALLDTRLGSICTSLMKMIWWKQPGTIIRTLGRARCGELPTGEDSPFEPTG